MTFSSIVGMISSLVMSLGKNIISGFKKFFVWLFKDIKRFIIASLLVILCVMSFQYCSVKTKYDNAIQSHTDTVQVYKNKIGELYQMTDTYITDISNLKKENADLYAEVKNLKDNPVIVTKTEFVYKVDSLAMKTDTIYVYVDSLTHERILQSKFSYNDKWASISGSNSINLDTYNTETLISNIAVNGDITVDLIEKDKQLYFISKSSNPYIQINNIEGTLISPEKSKVLKQHFDKKWAVVIGVGPSLTVVNSTVKVVPAVQLTLGYKLFSF